jgi:hypothetical protein
MRIPDLILVLAARALAYGEQIECSESLFHTFRIMSYLKAGKIQLELPSFSPLHTHSKLRGANKNLPDVQPI